MILVKPLSSRRWEHCRSVGAYGYDLAIRWGADPMKAYLAGIFHDIARELPGEQLLALTAEYGGAISEQERRHPILLHGFVSAVIAQENYGIADEEILSAMAKHTLGAVEMSLLDKIIFIADEIEPLRQYDGVEELRRLAFCNLDQALIGGIEQSIQYLRGRGLEPHATTLALRENLLKENT